MTHDIWTAIAPTPSETRMIAMQGTRRTLLKASLRPDPQHHRALQAMLEALALWEGAKVRAALVAGDASTTCDTSLFREAFDDFGRTPLYTLDVVFGRLRQRRQIDPNRLGDFRDLRRLLVEEVAR